MCLAMADQVTGQLRRTRDNVNSLTGWGNPGTRGEAPSPTVNVYNRMPDGDISPAKDSLKVPPAPGGGRK